jgi:hypothetical protein
LRALYKVVQPTAGIGFRVSKGAFEALPFATRMATAGSTKLPLRLWAPPFLLPELERAGVARHFCFDVPRNEEGLGDFVTIVVDEAGVLGIVMECTDPSLSPFVTLGKEQRRVMANTLPTNNFFETLLNLSSDDVAVSPTFLLLRMPDGSPQWLSLISQSYSTEHALAHSKERRQQRMTSAVAKRIVNGIHSYYETQILEPSVRGFLFILEKQFPRNDLYLFELLQNAVDDGATYVRFESKRRLNGGTLRVTHNGRVFNPMDVIGLSSVGLSTKTTNRTVGFMGIGFKAVYKRFLKVHISDGTWSFQFEGPQTQEPSKQPAAGKKGNHGWVMLPCWDGHVEASVQISRGSEPNESCWCRFDLSRCVGGISAVENDLKYIPSTCPPLLGRTALANQRQQQSDGAPLPSWCLDWNGRKFVVSQQHHETLNTATVPSSKPAIEERFLIEDIPSVGPSKSSFWIFLSTNFFPGADASDAYAKHTKKEVSKNRREELSMFFRCSAKTGAPMAPRYGNVGNSTGTASGGGRLHAVLPTKIKLPFGFHVQGSWLLSVDRQDIQDSFENPWNRELLGHIPSLVQQYFQWIASRHILVEHSLASLTPAYEMMACPVERSGANPILRLVGVPLNLRNVETALFHEKLLPFRPVPPENQIGFIEGKHGILLPKPFIRWLKTSLLKHWLGKTPIDSVALGTFSNSELLNKSVGVLDKAMLHGASARLASSFLMQDGDKNNREERILNLFAAFGESLSARNQRKEGDLAVRCDAFLDDIHSWAIFPSARAGGEIVSASSLRFPDDDFYKLKPELQNLLQTFLTEGDEHYKEEFATFQRRQREFEERHRRWQRDMSAWEQSHHRGKGKRGRHQGGRGHHTKKPGPEPFAPNAPDKPTTLDNKLWNAMNTKEYSERNAHANYLLSTLRNVASETCVSTLELIHRAFEHYFVSDSGLPEHVAVLLLELTVWAQNHGFGSKFAFVLCNDEEPYTLQRTQHSFLSNAFGNPASKALSALWECVQAFAPAPPKLHFVSKLYMKHSLSSHLDWNYIFLKELHVNSGVQFLPKRGKAGSTILDKEVLSVIKIRSSKKEVDLPYGVGTLSNKEGTASIDVEFSPFFAWVLKNAEIIPLPGLLAFGNLLAHHAEQLDRSVFAFPGLLNPERKQIIVAKELRGCVKGDCKDEGTSPKLPLVPSILLNTPTRRRIFYLPPQQGGCGVLDAGQARWVKQLTQYRWVPVLTGEGKARKEGHDFAATVRVPSETHFVSPNQKEEKLEHLEETLLPASVCTAFKRYGLYEDLEFATKNPPSPLERFKNYSRRVASFLSDGSQPSGAITVTEARDIFLDLFNSDLSIEDKQLIKLHCKRNPLIPTLVTGMFAPINQLCCTLGMENSEIDDAKDIDLKNAMIDSSWLHDVGKGPLSPIAEKLSSVLRLSSLPTPEQTEAYLDWVLSEEPLPDSRGISDGYSLAVAKVLLSSNGKLRYPGPEVLKRLKFCVFSASKKRYEWIKHDSIVSDGCGERIYVNDNWKVEFLLRTILEQKGIKRLVLPDISQGQNPSSTHSSPSSRAAWQVIKAFRLPTLSDKSCFSVGIRSGAGATTEELVEEKKRFEWIINILENLSEYQDVKLTIPAQFLKCSQLFRVFKIFNDAPISRTCYCAWLGNTAIKVQGDVEDYVAELQEELIRRLPRKVSRPPPKLLNLLFYLEQGHKFDKFAKRHYGFVPPVPEIESPRVEIETNTDDASLEETKKRRMNDDDRPIASLHTEETGLPTTKRRKVDREEEQDQLPRETAVLSQGRGKSLTLPAWMTASASPATESELETQPKGVRRDGKLTCPVEPAGRGMGRTLPAWMAELEGTERSTVQDSSRDHFAPNEATSSGVRIDENSLVSDSAGRGKSRVVPAWMSINSNSQPPVAKGFIEADDLATKREAMNFLDTMVKEPAPNVREPPFSPLPPLVFECSDKHWRRIGVIDGTPVELDEIESRAIHDMEGVGLFSLLKN